MQRLFAYGTYRFEVVQLVFISWKLGEMIAKNLIFQKITNFGKALLKLVIGIFQAGVMHGAVADLSKNLILLTVVFECIGIGR